jgi:hypothetical protein
VDRPDDNDARVGEALSSIARMGDDPAGLAVLGDLLQERGDPLGEAISRVVLDPSQELRYLGLETFTCPPERGRSFRLPVFQLCPLARLLGLGRDERSPESELVLLPPITATGDTRSATFTMGGDQWDHEGPIHEVAIRPFLVARTPVTCGAYRAVLPGQAPWIETAAPMLPMHSVTWDDLQRETGYLGRLGLRLPSEAEWEYACRGGSTGAYCFGDDERLLDHYAFRAWAQHARPVARGLVNAYGLYDVHGNVKEWCQDRWHTSYRGAPVDGSPWERGRSKRRVVRGGSRNSIDVSCRCAARSAAAPNKISAAIGFRPARSA